MSAAGMMAKGGCALFEKDSLGNWQRVRNLRHYKNIFEPVTDGLIQSLQFNGELTDNSGNGWNGTYSAGSPTYVTGQVGNALSLDGSHNVDAGSTDSLMNYFTGTNCWAVACWIKTTQSGYVWALYDDAWTNYIGLYIENDGNPTIYRKGVGYSETPLNLGIDLMDENWHLIYCSYDPVSYDSPYLFICVDGNFSGAYYDYVIDTGVISADVFSHYTIGYANSAYYTGSVDQYRVFNRDLDSVEVVSLYEEIASGLWVRDRAVKYKDNAGDWKRVNV